jgi:hypothetical protein
MRQTIILLIALLLVISLGALVFAAFFHPPASNANTDDSQTSTKGLAFIENVLPIDSSMYKVTFKPPHPSIPIIDDRFLDETYSLEAENSSLTFICSFYEDVLYSCILGVDKGSAIPDQQYANTADALRSFLEKYQAYSKLDSTEMIAMLADVDPAGNTTVTSGDLKLIVTHKNLTGTAFGDSVNFRWLRPINGCEYLYVNAVFRDGVFAGFIDHRARYSIGDTIVTISKGQAIEIALEAIKSYSYRMSDDWIVTGFDVIEYQIIANLVPQVREANILYPAWSVTLPLNRTYPGSVRELLVGIWAGTGEVYFVHHQAYATPT